jgi:hypothetical protein
MEFRKINQDLYILFQGSWNKINLEGPGTLTLGSTKIDYIYENGLPVSAVVVTPTTIEELNFQQGLLRRRHVKKSNTDPGTFHHYLNNVLLTSTSEVEDKTVVIRHRPRLIVRQRKNDTTFEVLDDKFRWLIALDPNYRERAQYGAPFLFPEYMKFYSNVPSALRKRVGRSVRSGRYTVKWETIDGYIDGEIIIDNFYQAIVTKSVLEEETVLNFRYVYTEGKVLSQIFINDKEQKLNNGVLDDAEYKGGFLMELLKMGKPIGKMRPNIPYTDTYDEIRDAVRNVLPLSSFE